MLIAGFPAGSFAANCYVVAPGPGEECVIIDPGQDAEAGIEEILAEHRLKPVAVLLTHGHIDHIWSVVPVCGARDIPAYIHPSDRALLSDPARGLGLPAGQQLFGGLTFTEPDDVAELTDGMTVRLAGVELVVDHAPGHTPGSVTFRAAPGVMFSGDLLFAGSIGRTDLPGGDYPAILDSLARVCLTLPDDVQVLPGHGPGTTIGAERASNPFLAGLPPGHPFHRAPGHQRPRLQRPRLQRPRHQAPCNRRPSPPCRPAARGGAGRDCEQERLTKAMIRTHEAGTLRPAQAGERVTLAGWVSRRRDHGGVVFIDLRDASGVVQVVFRGEGEDRPEHALRAEFCIQVTGELRLRPAGNENPELPTGEVEVVADEPGGLEVLSEADPLPFPIEGGGELSEDVRLRYRYLDIRRAEMAAALRLRSEATYLASEVLRAHGFVYVETPYLTRSTPEGARDFLVPVRLRPGNWYALPQSPQLFKQLLMVGGLERYYQLARCFRDEDFRADRQPEFTQIDLEMSFVDREDVIEVSEDLVGRLWAELAGYRVPRPIPRMTYAEAMRRFGSDKPDLRFGCELADLTVYFGQTSFRVFQAPHVGAVVMPGGAGPDAPGTGRLAGMGTRPRRARPGLRADRPGRGGGGVGAGRAAPVGHRKAGPGGRGRRGARGLRLLRRRAPRPGP